MLGGEGSKRNEARGGRGQVREDHPEEEVTFEERL